MKIKRLLFAALAALAMTVGASTAAVAATPEDGPTSEEVPPPFSDSTSLAPEEPTTPPADGVQPFSFQTGIAPGCYGQLDNVHKSGGMASVHGRTVCPSGSGNYVSLSIGYIGWFGERYAVAYNDAAGSGSNTASGQVKSVCSGKGLQTWRAFGYHSTFQGGSTKYGNTSKDGRFSC